MTWVWIVLTNTIPNNYISIIERTKIIKKRTLTFNVCGFPTCVFIESVKERKRLRLIDSFSVHILCIYDNVQSKCTNSTTKYSDQARNDTSVEYESFLAVAVHADGHQHVLHLLLLNLLLMVLLLHPGYPEQTPLPNSCSNPKQVGKFLIFDSIK